ncbi:SURF1 family protein [Mangrovicoccus algicola]|uniref:SURF1-like protein n=1 Tax=Mangrovicoccus algicola TaxID=2771008 RepID=A0A8J7CUP7_9RHOB|nr:SURF1 family protein [Mangrovicoccus algicola]MBE3637784.1 SURF1 family protein [Mangrovicoccus algicola]
MSRYVAPFLIGVLGTLVLMGLGVWQMQRLEWKQAVLAEIDTRLALPAEALPLAPDPLRDRFRPVRLQGRLGEGRALVATPADGGGAMWMRVIRPLELPDGRRILLELGRTTPEAAELLDLLPVFEGEAILYWPQETDIFTPAHEPGSQLWYARDPELMARELGTEPLLAIVRAADTVNPMLIPSEPDPTRIPNNHLNYAVTWFGLAIVWAGMTVFWLLRLRRRRYLER